MSDGGFCQTSHKAEVLPSKKLENGLNRIVSNCTVFECIDSDNGFKQVQRAYPALISYLDKLVQPSYTLPSSLATPWAC